MWKDYAINSIKKNKATSISIAAAALVASTLLSLLCGILYNFWVDDMQNSGYSSASLTGILYMVILLLAGVMLVLIIHNAFVVAMDAKTRQLGLLQSIGATPRQIRSALLQEAFLLSAPPAIVGTIIGIGLNYLFMRVMINLSHQIVLPLRETEIAFHLHPLVVIGSLVLVFATVLFSAWIPARRLSKISPLEAIRAGSEQEIKKVRKYPLSKLLGIEGELTRKSLYARRKAFRMSSISLLLAFFAFSAFLNTDTLSTLSTQKTYFDKLAVETRAEALENDQRIRSAYRLVIGGLCGLVALIGMSNVFANALGGVSHRRREFARYASIGMTPQSTRKMMILEAIMVSTKPILVSILLNILYVIWGLRAASIPAADYLQSMPLIPILVFALLILLFVGLAYFIGGSKIDRWSIADSLRDDTLL